MKLFRNEGAGGAERGGDSRLGVLAPVQGCDPPTPYISRLNLSAAFFWCTLTVPELVTVLRACLPLQVLLVLILPNIGQRHALP